jgi:nitroreductase
MEISDAIETRSSCRAFQDRPVPHDVLEKLMSLACRAPSAINLQPWQFTVVEGDEVSRLSAKLMRAHAERGVGCKADSATTLPQIYLDRQGELSVLMKPLMVEAGVDAANFVNHGSLNFYGAPSVVVATGHTVFTGGRPFDVGLAVGWLLLAAKDLGLDTCPIGLVCAYEDVIKDFLNIDDDRQVMLAVAVGYGVEDSPINRMISPRAPLKEVVRWY